MPRSIPPARAARLREEGATAVRDARDAFDAAWPYRHTDLRARITARCNVRTLKDLRDLNIREEL